MKKIYKLIVVTIMLTIFTFGISEANVSANDDMMQSVNYTLKAGTLTVYGNGEMPNSMTFEENKNIKKVIIKNGVTSVSNKAFKNCRELKKVEFSKTVKSIGFYSFYGTAVKNVVIPKTVKIIGSKAFNRCRNLKKVVMPGNFKYLTKKYKFMHAITDKNCQVIRFNTDFNPNNVEFLRTNKFIVRKDDSNYRSIHGSIYSKDGKELLFIPSNMKNLKVKKGCEIFHVNAINYSIATTTDGCYRTVCTKLKSITLPNTIKKIKGYPYTQEEYFDDFDKRRNIKLNLKCKLSENQLSKLLRQVDFDMKDLSKKLHLNKINKCYLNKANAVICYEKPVDKKGNAKIVDIIIPDQATRICDMVFSGLDDVKKVKVGKSVKSIGNQAFSNGSIKEIVLPKGLKRIGNEAFGRAESMNNKLKINIPDTVEHIGKFAFYDTLIGNVVIPASVKTIGKGAFWCFSRKKITYTILRQNRKGYDKDFIGVGKNITLKYKGNVSYYSTNAELVTSESYYEKNTYKHNIYWNKIKNIDGYKIELIKYNGKNKSTKKYNVKANKSEIHIRMKGEYTKLVVKMKPYKIVKGKTVYGKTTKVID